MERTRVIMNHLHGKQSQNRKLQLQQTSSAAGMSAFAERDDDIVVVSAKRTPLCKARRGHFKDTLPDDLLSAAFSAVIKESGVPPAAIGDICVGNVLQPGSAANIGRIAQFFSGIPETVPLSAVNRQCSSGLQACANIAASIKAGYCDIGLAAGVESMTVNSMSKPPEGFVVNPRIGECEKAMDCILPMGMTSENVAERFGVSRQKQDQMAVDSHAKAAAAQKSGWFDAEITPVHTHILDTDGEEKPITVTQDDGIREGTTLEKLGKLRTVFKDDGTTTAGNSSQLTDGAAAVLLASRSAARRYGLPVLGVMRSFAVVGVPPDVMGIGPAHAIPEALARAGLKIEDIDIYEINEAFGSQAVYCVEKLGIPMEKVNPKGGALALGHPLGCTGARQVGTLLHELKRRGQRGYGVVSMCIGTGMGAAAVFEYPGC